MYYRIPTQPLPEIQELSLPVRKTTWRCADKRNILVYVREGSCMFTINMQTHILKKGNFLLIPAEQAYIRKPHNDTDCALAYIHFKTQEAIIPVTPEEIQKHLDTTVEVIEQSIISPTFTASTLEKFIFLPQITDFNDDKDHKVTDTLNALCTEFHKKQYYNQLFLSLKVLELLTYLGKVLLNDFANGAPLIKKSYPPQLQKAIFYINKNYKQKISIETLSKHCGVSPQHLIRLFRKHLNTTPIQYVNKNKILHAIEMLRTTNLSIKEISYELGFDNPNYFSRLFKKEEKMSPVDTRHRILNYLQEKVPSPASD